MGTLTASTHVSAPIERVFGVFTDIGRAAERIPAITSLELLTDGPFGNGTRWRETRLMFKKEATEEMWVTNFDPPKSYTVEAESHGIHYTTQFRFVPENDGVTVSWIFDGKALSLGAKIMSPIFGFMMTGLMRKCMLEDLEALKAVCEEG